MDTHSDSGDENEDFVDAVQDEKTAIECTYPDEVEDLTDKSGVNELYHKYIPFKKRIFLTPSNTTCKPKDCHILVTIELTADNNYPLKSPKLEVIDFKGITPAINDELIKGLYDTMSENAKNKQVVLFDLIYFARNFLKDNETEYCESEHARMLAKQEAMKLKKEKEEEEKRQMERSKELSDLQELEVAHEEFKQRDKNRKPSLSISFDQNDVLVSSPTKLERNRSRFDSLHFDNCEGGSRCVDILETLSSIRSGGKTVFKCRDTKTSEIFVIHQWIIPDIQLRKVYLDADLEDVVKHVWKEIKNRLIQQSGLDSDYILKYTSYKISFNNVNLEISLLQPYIGTCNLAHYISKKVRFGEDALKYFSNGILSSLEILHDEDIFHGDLRESCIFMNTCGSDILKVADALVEHKIIQFFQLYEKPNQHNAPSTKSQLKRDLHSFGAIMLGLYQGYIVLDGCSPCIPNTVSDSFEDFLRTCFGFNASIDTLKNHEFLNDASNRIRRTNLPMNLENKIEDSESLTDCENTLDDLRSNYKCVIENEDIRLRNDYEGLSILGKGAFGTVYKARNTTDRRVYAIKMIKLEKNQQSTNRILKEAETLSNINHENIVRYCTSWIEIINEESTCHSNKIKIAELADEKDSEMEESRIRSAQTSCADVYDGDNDTQDYLGRYDDDSDGLSYIQFEEASPVPEQPKKIKCNEEKPENDYSKNRYLFIKMEFCENQTLRQALDSRILETDQAVWQYMYGILNGLQHIHSKNIIHRDLKPGNIFVGKDNCIKIGDFGLATVDPGSQNTAENLSNDFDYSNGSDGVAGTPVYQAPEMIKASLTEKFKCTTKLDMYSLGIIFFEIVYQINSAHERGKLIGNIRKKEIIIPEDFDVSRNHVKVKILKSLLDHDPEIRISATDLMKSNLIPCDDLDRKFNETLSSKLMDRKSEVYYSTLNHILKPLDLKNEEMRYMHMLKEKKIQQVHLSFVSDQISEIFKMYGGIWVSTPTFIPKGTPYTDTSKKYHFVSQCGNPLTFCSDLRYSFARFVATKSIKNIRGYSIGKVLYLEEVKPHFPQERHECAFDIISVEEEEFESSAKSLNMALDVVHIFGQYNPAIKQSVTIELSYLKLAKSIMSACISEEKHHDAALEIIKRETMNPDSSKNIMKTLTSALKVPVDDNFQRFFDFEGDIENFQTLLNNIRDNQRKKIQEAFIELKKTVSAITKRTENSAYFFKLNPLIVISKILYSGIAFKISFARNKKSKRYPVLAHGGSYTDLIKQQRLMLPPSERTDVPVSAVGLSFSLEILTAALFSNQSAEVPAANSYITVGTGAVTPKVLVAYIGEERLPADTKLAERLDFVHQLRKFTTADHICLKNDYDLKYYGASFFLVFRKGKNDKISVRHKQGEGLYYSEQNVQYNSVINFVNEKMNGNQKDSSSEEDIINVEMVYRDHTTRKALSKNDEQKRTRAVINILSRGGINWRNFNVHLYCLDTDKECVSLLSALDWDAPTKGFLESLSMFFRDKKDKDYIEKVGKSVHQKMQKKKSSSKPLFIMAYSLPSDFYKKIYV